MINLLSIHCSLAFTPYLADSLRKYLREEPVPSTVVRQGGVGLTIRADGGLVIRHQNRESLLARVEASHYDATVEFRREFYTVRRTSDEVILSNIGRQLMLSHPQSNMWLDAEVVALLLTAAEKGSAEEAGAGLPDWLSISTAEGRLLLSDQRNGRWVLLGRDHLDEMAERAEALRSATEFLRQPAPPIFSVKGVAVHLQSAFRLLQTLSDFTSAGKIQPYEDVAPEFVLRVVPSTEGVEIMDLRNRATLNAREARKWADLLSFDLERLNAKEVERGAVRTIFADGEGGRWVLQAGDEVFMPSEVSARIKAEEGELRGRTFGTLEVRRTEGFLLALHPMTGSCVALTREELSGLGNALA